MRMIACLAALLPVAAAAPNLTLAQEYESVGSYRTTLGASDMQNSSGLRLTDFCAIVQQDRANYHRFGIRDPGDQGDPHFANRSNRSKIAGNCTFANRDAAMVRDIENGIPRRVSVDIQGWGNRVDFVFVAPQ